MKVFFIILLITEEIVLQEITLCNFPKIGSRCHLICKTPDLKKTVIFKKRSFTIGSCVVADINPVCEPINNRFLIGQNESTNETRLTIKSLDKIEDEGNWYCEYNNRKSNDRELKTYEMIDNSSPSGPDVTEKDGFIIVTYKTNCLTPEPTVWLTCKNSEQQCKVSYFGEEICGKQSLKSYNVTCNTTAECFDRNAAELEVKVYGNITINVVPVIYKKKPIPDTEKKNQDQGLKFAVIAIILIAVVFVIAIIIGIILKKHQPEWIKNCSFCNGRKQQNYHQPSKDDKGTNLKLTAMTV